MQVIISLRQGTFTIHGSRDFIQLEPGSVHVLEVGPSHLVCPENFSPSWLHTIQLIEAYIGENGRD